MPVLYIHSLYNQADVCRADHNHIYETKVRVKRKLQKSDFICRHVLVPWLASAPYCTGNVLPTTGWSLENRHLFDYDVDRNQIFFFPSFL